MKDGTQLIYLHEDAGRITDTGVYLAPGEENVVTVGIHLNAELAAAFVERGICGVYEDPAAPAPAKTGSPRPLMPWLDPKPEVEFDPEAIAADARQADLVAV